MFNLPPSQQPQPQFIAKCGNELCNRTVGLIAHKPGEAEHILIEHYWYPIPAVDAEGQPTDIWICPECAPIWKHRLQELKSRLRNQTLGQQPPPTPENPPSG